MTETPVVAYFSMDIGLESTRPTYAGGLGVLAGDTLRAAADLEVPMVAVILLHPQGYFYQRLEAHGRQSEGPVHWSVEHYLAPRAPEESDTLRAATLDIIGLQKARQQPARWGGREVSGCAQHSRTGTCVWKPSPMHLLRRSSVGRKHGQRICSLLARRTQ